MGPMKKEQVSASTSKNLRLHNKLEKMQVNQPVFPDDDPDTPEMIKILSSDIKLQEKHPR